MALTIRGHLSSHRFRDFLLVAIFTLLLADRLVPAVRALAQEGDDRDAASRAALLNSFTYQGRVEVDGVPLTGTVDLEVSLFDVASGGAALQTLPILTGVPVDNGLFTVQLSFGNSSFQGERRWLEVRSRPDAQTAFTLLGRQELTATPYALYAKSVAYGGNGSATTAARSDHTHVGQAWSSGDFDDTFSVTNTDSFSGDSAVKGTTLGIPGRGVMGEGLLGGTGVYGMAIRDLANIPGSLAIGVHGRSCASGLLCPAFYSQARSAGVYGDSYAGAGVYGVGTSTVGSADHAGVVGRGYYGMAATGVLSGIVASGGQIGASATNAQTVGSVSSPRAGVVAKNTTNACLDTTGSLAGYCVGVWGQASSGIAGIGLYGYGSHVGVFADAPAGNYGIWSTRVVYSEGGFQQPSDERLKTDAGESAGLVEILRLQPRSFRWLNPDKDDGRRHQGLFAQEVAEVLPDLVTSVESMGDPHYAMDYTELIPVLIRAIQEQQAQIETLRSAR